MAASSKSRMIAVPTIALMSLAVLAGCGSSDDQAASSASSVATGSATASSAGQSAAAKEASPEKTQSAAAQAVTPEGYKQVTASNNGVTFAVPESWEELDSETLANTEVFQAILEKAAAGTDFTPEQLKAQMSQFDFMARNPKADGIGEAVNVQVAPVALPAVPTKEETQKMVSAVGATATDYQAIETPLGKGVKQNYTLEAAGLKGAGAFLIVPSGDGNGFSVVTVLSATPESANTLADNVVSSLSKAS